MRLISVLVLSMVAFTSVAHAQLVFPDASIQSTAAPEWEHTVFLPASGTPTENGTELRAAIAAVSVPTLIQLEPGSYDIGATPLNITTSLLIRGVGRFSVITGSGTRTMTSTISGDVQLEDINVLNTTNGATAVIETNVSGFFRAFRSYFRNTMNAGTGVVVSGGNAIYEHCEIGATIGVSVTGGSLQTFDTYIAGFGYGVQMSGATGGSVILKRTTVESFGTALERQAGATWGLQVYDSSLGGQMASLTLNNIASATIAGTTLIGTRSGVGSVRFFNCYTGVDPIIDSGTPVAP